MKIKLEDELGRIFEFDGVTKKGLTIGREGENDFDVSAQKEEKEFVKGVSRKHAIIYPKGKNGTNYSAPSIVDLRSTNGTMVNKKRVYNEECFFWNGDVIRFGCRYLLKVKVECF